MDGKARRDAFGRRELLVLSALGLVAGAQRPAFAGSPQGQLTWAVHVSLAPTWFDPAETPGMITPFLLMYALHDAMVKPMPGNAAEPCLAEPWKMAPDGLSYEFTVRAGAKFHNGEPVTAEDVKFSFERYRGTSAALMKERVAAVETPDERRVRFVLKKPWPDFLTFYSSRHRSGLDRAEEIRPAGRRGRASRRRRSARGRTGSSPSPRGWSWCSRPSRLLAQDARRQAAGLQGGARRGDAAGGAEARRGRHRLLDPRRAGRGAAEDAGPDAEAGGDPGHVLALFPRPVGPEIAVARPARARGGAAGDRLQVDLRGADARLFADHQQHHPRQLRLLLEAAGAGIRSRPRPRSCWPRRDIRNGFDAGDYYCEPPTPISPRRCSTICRKPASA